MSQTAHTQQQQQQHQQQPLLTPTSLSVSLAPPRTPPIHSWIHRLHQGRCVHDVLRSAEVDVERLVSQRRKARRDTNEYDNQENDDEHAASMLRSHELLARMLHVMARRRDEESLCRCRLGNHTPHHHHHHHRYRISASDRFTRFLGSILPLQWQHEFRDSGNFRWVADSLVQLTCPLMAVGRWKELRDFIQLSRPPWNIISNSHCSSSSWKNEDNDNLQPNSNHDSDDNHNMKRRRGRRSGKWRREVLRYGPHDMQYMDLYWPNIQHKHTNDNNNNNTMHNPQETCHILRGILFFLHGGAWGSGHPWMYRLVAPIFLQHGFIVAIVGYRTFPDAKVVMQDLHRDDTDEIGIAPDDNGSGERSQLCDVKCAWEALQQHVRNDAVVNLYRDREGWVGNVLMGHSSGAHVALLLLVESIAERWKDSHARTNTNLDKKQTSCTLYPDVFIGLSGPYDINHHYHFEAGRGVEQLSPMKAICGATRENFTTASPVSRLQKLLSTKSPSRTLAECTPPLLLIHGIEDTTVPFTATADAARALRSCGVVDCEEIYLEKCGHQDVVLQFMLGGAARDLTMEYLLVGGEEKKKRRRKGSCHGEWVSRRRMEVTSRL
eukprot:CCRYP_001516-RA/>CCRYP_001516-RA protein AED:0.37 eAED:0.37 QI:65/1/1/1/1/1/2/343/606